MKVVVVVCLVETIPLGVLIGGTLGCPLSRRSGFWLRFVGVVIAMLLPALVAILAMRFGEQTAGPVLLLAIPWGLLLIWPSRLVLFHGWSDRGPDDDGGDGPGPGDGRGPSDRWPTPPAPIGGIPLPDAEPSSTRVRDHRPPRRPSLPRRRTRQRERVPVRFWPLWLWASGRLSRALR